jgi:hypothetical protein
MVTLGRGEEHTSTMARRDLKGAQECQQVVHWRDHNDF